MRRAGAFESDPDRGVWYWCHTAAGGEKVSFSSHSHERLPFRCVVHRWWSSKPCVACADMPRGKVRDGSKGSERLRRWCRSLRRRRIERIHWPPDKGRAERKRSAGGALGDAAMNGAARAKLFTIRVSETELAELQADAAAFGDTTARWTRRCWQFGRTSLRPVAVPLVGAHHGAKRGANGGKPPRKGKVTNGAKSKKARKSRR
jgi:hypothetical protein